KAEIALRESEERFHTIADLSPFPISIIDQDGRYLYINRKFTEMFGYALSDIPSGKEWFMLAFPDPNYREDVIKTWMSDLQGHGVGEVRPRQFKVRCRNGEVRDILFRPVTLSDKKQYVTYEDLLEVHHLSAS
ncbi:MAG TPA: PAS domain S-box protein, partial [Methanomicrobiales archaeon]|nr:PAS domain S-box protein [Methanomicrobiales archaeon]